MTMIPGRVNPHDTFPCRFSRRKVQLDRDIPNGALPDDALWSLQEQVWRCCCEGMRKYRVSWCQHVDPEDPDNMLTTWCYGMTWHDQCVAHDLRAEASQNSVADNAA